MRIIVTGAGGASGYAVALQAEQFGYDVLWADADPLCPGLLLRPERAWLLPLASEGADYLKGLTDAAAAFGATCVSINTDAEIRYASAEAKAVAGTGLTCWTPDHQTVSTCLDKLGFAERLAGTGSFRTPRLFTFDELCQDFPEEGVFLKRRAGSGARDAILCTSRLTLEAWLARNPGGLLQEFLTGQEFSADCLYTGSDSPLVVLRKRLRTRSGMSTVTETFRDDHLEASVADLVRELNVIGPSCVQGFLQPDDVCFTEVNVRFGGGCAAAAWGSTHLVEIYLGMLTTGSREIPDGVPKRRPPTDVTLIRPHSYFTLSGSPDISRDACRSTDRLTRRTSMAGASALVIAPHPDDETFGCGGTIAALAASGVEVFVQVIVQHEINTGGPDTELLPAERGEELACACSKLGVAGHHIMIERGDHRNVLHSDLAKLVEFLEKTSPIAIDRVRPQIVLLPARSSFHQDHKLVHQAAFAACRNRGVGHHSPQVVLGYQCPEDSWSAIPEQTTCSVDVTAQYGQKQAAIECYHRQVKPDPHLRSMSSIERSDLVRGAALGVRYAEAFITYRTSLFFSLAAAQAWQA